jgi:hypothetical protein
MGLEGLMKTVWIYVETSKQVGDKDHLKIFATTDAAEKWFEENDPEGVAFEYEVLEWRGRQLRRPYFMIRQPAPAAATVMAADITMDSAISFAHSQ